MRSDVKRDWEWANEYKDAIAAVLRENSIHMVEIKIASEKNDLKEATDLVVMAEEGTVAVRIRRPGYSKRYRDLTLRAWRKSGAKTELDKIREGFARWYLYCWADGHGGLADWMLIDNDILRASGLLDNPEIIKNRDRVTGFIAISDGRLMINRCLVAQA
jgi:hypothetical protein